MSAATDVLGTVLSSGTPWGKILGLVGGVGTGILNYFQTKRQNAHLAAALVLAIAVFGGGCPRKRPVAAPAAPVGAGQQVSNAQAAANNAQTAATTADAGRLTKVRANIDAAATAPNIDAAPVAQNELIVAQGRLSDVKPDPAEAAAAAERRALVESGRAEEARQNALAAAEAGKRDAAVIAELRTTADKLAAERDKLAAELIAIAERNRLENQKAIDAALAKAKKARDELDNAERSEQVAWCNKIGFSALGVAVALKVGSWLLGGLVAIRKMGPAAGIIAFVGLCALWAARVLGHPWFMPGMTIVLVIVLTWVILWWRKHDKRGDLNEELAHRGAKAKATLDRLVPVIDAVHREGTQTIEEVAATLKGGVKATIQQLLDAVLFSPLSAKLDTPEKDTVKQVRETVDPIKL